MNKFLYPFLITLLLAISLPIKAERAAYFLMSGECTPEMLVNEKLDGKSRWTFAGAYSSNSDLYSSSKYGYHTAYYSSPTSLTQYLFYAASSSGYTDNNKRSFIGDALELNFEIDPSTANASSNFNKALKITTTYQGEDYYLTYKSETIEGSSCRVLTWVKGKTNSYEFYILYSSASYETSLYIKWGSDKKRIDSYQIGNKYSSTSYFCIEGYVPSTYYKRTVGVDFHRKYSLDNATNDIKFGTYNNESDKEFSVNTIINEKKYINIVCPTSGSLTLPLYFTKTDKVSATFPSSMTGVTMTDYTPSNYDSTTANGKTMLVTPEAAGKSYSVSIKDSNSIPYRNSTTTAVEPITSSIVLNFVSQDQVYWTYKGTKIPDNTMEVEYINDNVDVTPFRLTSSLSHRNWYSANVAYNGSRCQFLQRINNNGFTFANNDQLDFSDKDKIVATINPYANSEFVNIFGSMPNLKLTIKPYKPTLTLTTAGGAINHDASDFTIEIPQGSFEAGSGTNMYARVLLIPQFDAYGAEEDAIEALGGAPREGIKDTWLDHSWYKDNNLVGYLPEMQWDATNKKYTCRITPENMTFMDWQGNKTTGHRLVSGHYKVQIVPCEGTNSHQYGIVASEPADLYITPSAKDMAMYLCVKGADGQPTWKEYVMDNTNLSFEGPKADDHGETAYRHTRLVPNSDYSEVWVESSRHRPADQDEKDFHPNKVSRRAAARATEVVRGSLDGYTKVEPDDYIDLSGVNSANIKLVKNGVASEAQTISVSKSGDNIITGIEDVAADAYDSEAEYYTTSGIRVSEPLQPGIYIERRANGRSRKITVK